MARAIDAEGLAKKVNEEICRCDCVISTMFARRFKKLIEEAPAIEPKQEWISVKDRPPEIGQNVLVCYVDPDSGYGIKVLSLECDEKGTYWDDGDGWWFEPEDMSHWMPLPEPPEKNNEEEQA